MSKASLKKELKQLTRDQLESLIIEAYESRKEIKEYFEYFLNPDIEKLNERFRKALDKEAFRSKRGYSKTRITELKRMIKNYAGFQPGFDQEINFMILVVNICMLSEISYYWSESQMAYLEKLVDEILDLADRNMIIEKTIARLTNLFETTNTGTKYLRHRLYGVMEQYQPKFQRP
ncbi:MAG: DUF6155 family protein [Muribaculum sp.]|nr:DUF6155 family protein [Muribaculum sp.]